MTLARTRLIALAGTIAIGAICLVTLLAPRPAFAHPYCGNTACSDPCDCGTANGCFANGTEDPGEPGYYCQDGYWEPD